MQESADLMSEWTTAFCDVCHEALLFAKAYRLMQVLRCRPYYIYQHDLAQARARLMIVCAAYRILRERQIQGAS